MIIIYICKFPIFVGFIEHFRGNHNETVFAKKLCRLQRIYENIQQMGKFDSVQCFFLIPYNNLINCASELSTRFSLYHCIQLRSAFSLAN